MNLEEHAAKPLLAAAGIAVPAGELVGDAAGAGRAAAKLGPCMVKAQVPAGRRGKAGGIRAAATPAEAEAAARAILGLAIGGHPVERLLVERRIAVQRELYAAVLTDAASKGPLILAAAAGGIDVEELAVRAPDALVRIPVDIRHGITAEQIAPHLAPLVLQVGLELAELLARLYRIYADHDLELVEVNPLALAADGALVALDCKLVLDDAAAPRRPELAALASPELRTPLEQRAQAHGLRLIELDGDVGVLANGAGLTMATMDAVRHHGGAPANFLEIGGEAYRLGRPALELVLAMPRVRSLAVNFCGAFARTDVMADAITQAWQELRPRVPVFFSIHGTGEDAAIALVRERLGLEPYDLMDDAVRAAVEAAAGVGR
jgi:succinyl-CoA synthetase beta subunit